jgi:hypothetical protein
MLTRMHEGTPTKRCGAKAEIRSYVLGLVSFAAEPQNDWSAPPGP